jgi:Na+/H+ antiporter NhaD/arsenite permease-like protein
MNISVIVLAIVFILIALRQIGPLTVQIWQIMLFGCAAVLIAGEISLREALHSINLDVMLFLFGMFVVGQALEESGYLAHLSYRYFKSARSIDQLILYILFGAGLTSAFLMNDTLAIIGTPVVLLLARKHEMSPKLLLLALCFSITTGSVMSPIGNPQNLLIALNGPVKDPFFTFFMWLFVPTIVNLFLAYVVLRHYYKDDFHEAELTHSQEPIRNHDLALLARISLQIVIILVIIKSLLAVVSPQLDFRITYIALAAALPVLLGSPKRFHILRHIDWHTLVFFAAMFILMESVWDSGFFQALLQRMEFSIASVTAILIVSSTLSQFMSNVPLVALYLPMLAHAGVTAKELMALAAGSTIAGNALILGAASNVIVIQNAEKKAHQTISFWEFARIGIPLTLLNLFVYWLVFVLF